MIRLLCRRFHRPGEVPHVAADGFAYTCPYCKRLRAAGDLYRVLMLRCAILRHRWKPHHNVRRQGPFRRTFWCDRCEQTVAVDGDAPPSDRWH